VVVRRVTLDMIYKEREDYPSHGVDSSKVEVHSLMLCHRDDTDVTLTKVFTVPDSGKHGCSFSLRTGYYQRCKGSVAIAAGR
jgi:hypothetical protein